MTGTNVAVAAGVAILAAGALLPESHDPVLHMIGVIANWAVLTGCALFAVLLVGSYGYVRIKRNQAATTPSKATGIQLLPTAEVDYDGPATLHYPEGGDR